MLHDGAHLNNTPMSVLWLQSFLTRPTLLVTDIVAGATGPARCQVSVVPPLQSESGWGCSGLEVTLWENQPNILGALNFSNVNA